MLFKLTDKNTDATIFIENSEGREAVTTDPTLAIVYCCC